MLGDAMVVIIELMQFSRNTPLLNEKTKTGITFVQLFLPGQAVGARSSPSPWASEGLRRSTTRCARGASAATSRIVRIAFQRTGWTGAATWLRSEGVPPFPDRRHGTIDDTSSFRIDILHCQNSWRRSTSFAPTPHRHRAYTYGRSSRTALRTFSLSDGCRPDCSIHPRCSPGRESVRQTRTDWRLPCWRCDAGCRAFAGNTPACRSIRTVAAIATRT